MKILKMRDHMKYPGPRYKCLGPFSGEAFRDDVIWPLFSVDPDLVVDLSDVSGFGSSFLHEAFFGLIEKYSLERKDVAFLMENIVCREDSTIVEEVREYMNDALSD